MDELDLLRALLSPEIHGPRWHLDYGMTTARCAALTRGRSDSNSLLHPGSETALTLQILGLIDGWSQIDALDCTPRTDRDAWNSTFFANLREGTTTNYSRSRAGSKANRSSWASLNLFGRDPLDLEEAILVFEFDLSATEFHPPGKRLQKPSFLALPNDSGWATFDAVFIIPRMKLLLLFESKLNSDIGTGTTHFPFVNQIVRNLEAAYFLTSDPDSAYSGWDFRYVFVAPRQSFDWRLTQYSWVITHIEEQVEAYRCLLEEIGNEPGSLVNLNRFRSFHDFHAKCAANVRRMTWDDLIASLGPGGFSPAAYFNALGAAGVPHETTEAIRQRFAAAGIRY